MTNVPEQGCCHDGGILDIPALSRELDGISRQSADNFLNLFEGTHLIYRLRQFGYGKEVLRGKWKVYLADPALPALHLAARDPDPLVAEHAAWAIEQIDQRKQPSQRETTPL